MDYQEFVNKFDSMTCILSVEILPDGKYGDIRIVAGNKAYIDSIENAATLSASSMLDNKFEPNGLYTRYIPQDLNFEDFSYRSAVLHQALHTYIHPGRYDFWMHIIFMPLKSDEPGIGYCTYSQELSTTADTELMSEVSYKTASDVLKTCIKLRSTADFKETMDEVIKDIREICNAASCRILLTDFLERTCTVLCEDMAQDSAQIKMSEYIGNDFFDIVETWMSTIAGSTCFIAKSEQEMNVLKERNPLWYNSLKSANVESIVLFPLEYNEEILGFIWATNFDTESTTRIKETLEITAFFLASEIANHQLLNRLEILGSVDLLTGVKNRNAMNNRVDRLVAGTDTITSSLGVVFADLNGLKRVNDQEGHSAGDNMLKCAAEILKEVFYDGEIYRAGGDEFMIITTDLQETEFDDRVNKLRLYSDKSDVVNLAVGASFADENINILPAMRLADTRMYIDKEDFYRMHPDLKR